MRRMIMTGRALGALLGLAALLVVGVGPASAITHGQFDGNGHPYVGMVETFDSSTPAPENFLDLCSGTLISQRVFVTAGHCTDGAKSAVIWFGADSLDPSKPDATGTPLTVDGYAPTTHDLGAVVLAASYDPFMGSGGSFPTLPSVHQLDVLQAMHGQQATFTTVGYGRERSFPPAAASKDVQDFTRMVATPRLIQIDGGQAGDFGMVLSANAYTGGACFGDSGGPDLTDDNIIAGITVGLKTDTCGGNSLALRLDQEWSREWLAGLVADSSPT
jgi:Trypsin